MIAVPNSMSLYGMPLILSDCHALYSQTRQEVLAEFGHCIAAELALHNCR